MEKTGRHTPLPQLRLEYETSGSHWIRQHRQMFFWAGNAWHVVYWERIRSERATFIDSFGDDYIGTDFATIKWVRENTKIPVVEEMKYWKDDNSHFFLMKRVPVKV